LGGVQLEERKIWDLYVASETQVVPKIAELEAEINLLQGTRRWDALAVPANDARGVRGGRRRDVGDV
jgi:hypothetical protein